MTLCAAYFIISRPQGSSDASDSGESEEVVQLQNEALEAIKNKDVKALREILSRADPNLGVLNVPADKVLRINCHHTVTKENMFQNLYVFFSNVWKEDEFSQKVIFG